MTLWNSTYDPIIAKIEVIHALSAEEAAAVRELHVREAIVAAGEDIVREGEVPTHSCFILEGITCAYKVDSIGKRHIVAIHLPGDGPDLQSLHLHKMDISIAALTPCKIALVMHSETRRACDHYPLIAAALWRSCLVDGSVAREWVINSRRVGPNRVAHLFCEIYLRSKGVGLANNDEIRLPLTQAALADACGMSPVHINRSLQELRRLRLITFDGKVLKILDWQGLQAECDFEAVYLHLPSLSTAAN